VLLASEDRERLEDGGGKLASSRSRGGDGARGTACCRQCHRGDRSSGSSGSRAARRERRRDRRSRRGDRSTVGAERTADLTWNVRWTLEPRHDVRHSSVPRKSTRDALDLVERIPDALRRPGPILGGLLALRRERRVRPAVVQLEGASAEAGPLISDPTAKTFLAGDRKNSARIKAAGLCPHGDLRWCYWTSHDCITPLR
jgi:hypothetical protein